MDSNSKEIMPSLPLEVWEAIFIECDVNTIVVLTQVVSQCYFVNHSFEVCKSFRALCNFERFWKNAFSVAISQFTLRHEDIPPESELRFGAFNSFTH